MNPTYPAANICSPQQPLSIIMHDYDSHTLDACLNSIFGQRQIENTEVILCDNATNDGSWETAIEWMKNYPDRITLNRNQLTMSPAWNADKSIQMGQGKYYVELTRDRRFDPEYVLRVISQLEADPLMVHAYIGRTKDHHAHGGAAGMPSPELKRSDNPLVTINVYNYNYGRYLQQCLDSVASQTYGNIEICFSDNASTDESWQIALNFARRYPKRMSLTRNRMNLGPSRNLTNCLNHNQGKYMLMLCSDDALHPDFVARCVALLEQHPDAAFAMVHRDILDDEGRITHEPPFYDQTCLIPGEEQASVYMMAAVNPSVSQILYNRERTHVKNLSDGLNRWFGARVLDFTLCLDHPIIYVKEPLLLNRVHAMSDGIAIDTSLMQAVGQYALIHLFAEISAGRGFQKAASRLGEAVEKLGRLCLRYCIRFLQGGDYATAERYFHLSQAFFPAIANDDNFISLQQYWQLSPEQRESRQAILKRLAGQSGLTVRNASYPPPPNSLPC